MDKLKHIREKCIEANPEIKKRRYKTQELLLYMFEQLEHDIGVSIPSVEDHQKQAKEYAIHPIRLADVLLAIGDILDETQTYKEKMGDYFVVGHDEKDEQLKWNLKDDNLDNQSPETLEFIANLL